MDGHAAGRFSYGMNIHVHVMTHIMRTIVITVCIQKDAKTIEIILATKNRTWKAKIKCDTKKS
jgi:thiamine transporter ThiT